MKNRKFSKLSFDDAQILSREELKHVLGGDGYGGGGYGSGGTCCWHTADWSESSCHLYKDTAIYMQQHNGGLWCCASC